MHQDSFDDLKEFSSQEFAESFPKFLSKAQKIIDEKASQMVVDGEAYVLSDDEIRMLKAYRQFIQSAPVGSVFKWEAPGPETIVLPTEPTLIQDPQNLSDPPKPA